MFSQAANPGCLLEDFVRWYSPNDWLQGEETEDEINYRRKLESEQRQKGIDMSGQFGCF
jgi:Rab3 GTPase-activating protein catalytic subunit